MTEIDGALGAGLALGDADTGAAHAFYLAADDPRAVGRALRWAMSRRADRVEILAEHGSADLARRAGLLSAGAHPAIGVWHVEGAEASPAIPGPAAKPPTLPDAHWSLAGVMSEAGARPIDDHGVLIAEVVGLEVGRVIDGEDGPSIDVGVGQADRELNQLVHNEPDPGQGLRRVIAAVGEYRRPGSHHPLTRIRRERWLRTLLLDDPGLVDAESLEPLVPLRRWSGLGLSSPSASAGRLRSGRPVVVVAMAGIDLDLAPEAADYRSRSGEPNAALVVVVPERDLQLNTTVLDRVPDARAVAIAAPWD